MSPPARRRPATRKRILILILVVVPSVVAAALGVRHFVRSDPQREIARLASDASAAISAEKYDEARIILTKLIERAPENLRLRRQHIACLLELGRVEDAGAAARDLLRLDPDFAPAHSALALVHRRRGDLDAAIREARLATEGSGSTEGAWYTLADLLLDAGRRTEGLSALSRAVELGEGGTGGAIRLATLAAGDTFRGSALSSARRTLGRALDAAREEWEKAPESEESLLGFVRLAMLAGDPAAAATALVAVKGRRELSPPERLVFARAMALSGRGERGREMLEGMGAPVEGGVTETELALAWIEAGDPGRALAFVDRALESHPGTVPLLRLRVEALAQVVDADRPDRRESAERLRTAADTLLGARSRDEFGLRARAFANLVLGRLEDSLADAVALRDMGSSSPAAPWIQGLCLLRLGKPESAIPLLTEGRAAARTPEDGARWITKACVEAGDGPRAAREALHLKSDESLALRVAAEATAGHPDNAEELARRDAFSSSPPEDRISAAVALVRAGRAATARGVLDAVDPEGLDDWSRLRLGDAFRVLRERSAAERVYEGVAGAGGRVSVAALLRLGLLAVSGEEVDRDGLARVFARLEGVAEGTARIRTLEALLAVREKKSAEALAASAEAVRLLPDDRDVLGARLAALELAGSDEGEMDAVAERLLAIDPGHLGARLHRARSSFERGVASFAGGQLEAAEDNFSDVIEELPGAERARLLRGFARVGRGDLDQAEADARLLIESSDRPVRGHLLLGIVELNRNRPTAAVASIGRALAEEPESGTILAAHALALSAAGEHEAALASVDRLDRVEGGGMRALSIRARILTGAGRPDDAIKLLRAREEEGGPHVNAVRMLLSRICAAAGRPGDAALVLERAVSANPEAVPPRLALVNCLALARRYDEALGVADEIAGTEATRVPGLIVRSRVNRMRGDAKAEQADLRAVCAVAPRNVIALTRLGSLLVETGQSTEGTLLLERAAASAPSAVEARMRLAVEAERGGRIAEARELYEEVLAIRPSHPLAANNLSWHLAREGKQLTRAVDLAHTAVDARPEDAEYRDTLAIALAAAGLHREAAEESRTAMRLAPESGSIASSAVRVFRAAGLRDEAVHAAKKALELASQKERATLEEELRTLGLLED